MTFKHLAEIEAKPAGDQFVEHIAKTLLDMQAHDHASAHGMGDIYCANLAAYMGERIAPILVRLREAEAALATAKTEGRRESAEYFARRMRDAQRAEEDGGSDARKAAYRFAETVAEVHKRLPSLSTGEQST